MEGNRRDQDRRTDGALDDTIADQPEGSLADDLSGLATLLGLIAAAPSAREPGADIRVGSFADGAFEIERRLGAGGMGVVYLARDTQLDRQVAIKLPRMHGGAAEIERMRREAAAMARLSHPDVVRVYEVVTADNALFIVMEYMAGGTLHDWLDATKRPWHEVVDMFSAVGEGLAAAHVADIAHRDFKPDNVFIAEDGRPCVADFGLARGIGGAPEVADPGRESSGAIVLDAKLTQTGATLGTPRYMAPEQFNNKPVDARADQFAFCVALYEAVYGQHPFGGDSIEELRESISKGTLRAPPADRRVPKRIARILARGLRVDADERYPTMRALLFVLGRARTGWRKPTTYAAVALTTVALAGAAVWISRPAAKPAEQPCQGGAERIDSAWGKTSKARAKAGLNASGVGIAGEIWGALEPRLDRYRERWVRTYAEVCRATEITKERSEAALDSAMMCLNQARTQLSTLTDIFGKADKQVARRAVRSVDALPEPEACKLHAVLSVRSPRRLQPKQAKLVRDVTDETSRLRALSSVGKYDEAIKVANALVDRARDIDFTPTLAEALHNRGLVLRLRRGYSKQAVKDLEEALNVAYAAGHDNIVASAASELTVLAGNSGQVKQATRWFKMGLAAVKRMKATPRVQSALHCSYVTALSQGRDFKRTLSFAERCLKLSKEAFGSTSLGAAIGHINMGLAYLRAGKYSEAAGQFTTSKTMIEAANQTLRREYPNTLSHLATAQTRLGKFGDAEKNFRAALAAHHKLGLGDSLSEATANANFAFLLNQRGKRKEALKRQERSLEIQRKLLPPNSAGLARAIGNLAIANAGNGKLGRAVALSKESMEMLLEVYPKRDNPDLVNAHTMYGTLLRYSGKKAESLPFMERAVKLSDKLYPAKHPQKVNPLIELGHSLSALNKHERARAALTRAVDLTRAPNVPPPWTAEAKFALAKALQALRRNPARQRSLASEARAVYKKLGRGFAQYVKKIDAWLGKR